MPYTTVAFHMSAAGLCGRIDSKPRATSSEAASDAGGRYQHNKDDTNDVPNPCSHVSGMYGT
jgi:hypothetical protein